MEHPFFSVVTVVKNDYPGLLISATSLHKQTNQLFEWILIDGNSTDETGKKTDSLPVKPTIFISEPDNGIYDAMNKGIGYIKGNYTLFLNAGDSLQSETTLQDVQDFIHEQGDIADVVYAGTTLDFGNGRQHYRPPRNAARYIWHGLPAIHQATYIRSKILGGFRYPDSYRISGDYYLAAYLFKSGFRTIYYDKPVVRFRTGDTSFRHPYLIFREAYLIQRDVLHAGYPRIILSCLRRILSMLAMFCLVLIAGLQDKFTGEAR